MAEYISFQPKDFFNSYEYEGTSSGAKVVTDLGFQPDMLWFKQYDATRSWVNMTSPQGVTKALSTDADSAEQTNSNYLASFDSGGFTTGATQDNGTNTSGGDYMSYSWKMGTTSGIATNGSTTITPSAYSFNQTTLTSVVKYTGNGTSGAKVAHGLGVAPDVIIVKSLTGAGSQNWWLYHASATDPETHYFKLNTAESQDTSITAWNNTLPDSVNFTLGDAGAVNTNTGTHIAYCFASKKGFSLMTKGTGNGSTDGTFVYTGFRPAFVMGKHTNGAQAWYTMDTKRPGYNPNNNAIFNNTTAAQNTTYAFDIYSNGFKWRTSGSGENGSGSPFIYIVFAESPIVSSNDVPGVAR